MESQISYDYNLLVYLPLMKYSIKKSQLSNLVLIGMMFHPRQVKAQENEVSWNFCSSESSSQKQNIWVAVSVKEARLSEAKAERQCASSSRKLHKPQTDPELLQSVLHQLTNYITLWNCTHSLIWSHLWQLNCKDTYPIDYSCTVQTSHNGPLARTTHIHRVVV